MFINERLSDVLTCKEPVIDFEKMSYLWAREILGAKSDSTSIEELRSNIRNEIIPSILIDVLCGNFDINNTTYFSFQQANRENTDSIIKVLLEIYDEVRKEVARLQALDPLYHNSITIPPNVNYEISLREIYRKMVNEEGGKLLAQTISQALGLYSFASVFSLLAMVDTDSNAESVEYIGIVAVLFLLSNILGTTKVFFENEIKNSLLNGSTRVKGVIPTIIEEVQEIMINRGVPHEQATATTRVIGQSMKDLVNLIFETWNSEVIVLSTLIGIIIISVIDKTPDYILPIVPLILAVLYLSKKISKGLNLPNRRVQTTSEELMAAQEAQIRQTFNEQSVGESPVHSYHKLSDATRCLLVSLFKQNTALRSLGSSGAYLLLIMLAQYLHPSRSVNLDFASLILSSQFAGQLSLRFADLVGMLNHLTSKTKSLSNQIIETAKSGIKPITTLPKITDKSSLIKFNVSDIGVNITQHDEIKGVYLVTGPNGIGKSHLLRYCSSSTEIATNSEGIPTFYISEETLGIQYVGPDIVLAPIIKLDQWCGLSQKNAWTNTCIDAVGKITKNMVLDTSTLSTGQKKLLYFIHIVNTKEFATLILDEVLDGIDAANIAVVKGIIQMLVEHGKIIYIVDHSQRF
jgi:ABC-type transport system involved in cytochrome c biogenesis ATPase subunit